MHEIISKLTKRQKADLLTGRDFWSTLDIDELGLPSAYLSDGPHGLRKQAAASDHLGLNASIPATCYPTAASVANSWNEELGERLGEHLGVEAASMKVNVLLGPGMNIKRDPRCGRNFEYFSEDPILAGRMAASYVRGIQKNGVSACVKHFAANNQEERRMVIDSVVDERTMREIYLTGFEIAVKEGKPRAIMSSYNKLNGEFANENVHLLKEILRDEWGFDGVIVTDWAGCNDRIAGLIAGNELEMPGCRYGADDVYKALCDGSLDESLVDERLDNLISLILDTHEAIKDAPDTFDKEAHHSFAVKCAEECAVLLKNDNGALPLGREKVCFIGDFADKPRYQGAGSSVVNPTFTDKFINEVGNYGFEFTGYAQGFKRFGKRSGGLKKKAIKLAQTADKIVFFAGLDEVREAEGLDRANIKLPENQAEVLSALYELNKPVVVVLFCGSPVELDPLDGADSIVHAYLGGQGGVVALLNLLTGKVNFSGKLAESYPIKYEDCPSASNFPGHKMTVQYREGPFVGYRYYTSSGVKVKYPFGYGLSYTSFEYSDLEVTEAGAKFKITNTGEADGAEIAQLYISKPESDIIRPAREMKGFKKVFVKAGETAEVFIPFDEYTFRSYNPADCRWQIEGGEYAVLIGASSEDIRLEGKINKEGNSTDFGYDRIKLQSYFSGNAADVGDEEFEALLMRDIPKDDYDFYKKKRMVIHENCTVADLRYSKRWVGRLFSGAIRFARSFLWKIGKKTASNTITMGVLHQPVRGLAKFGGMSRRQMEALLMMFNGHLFKGIHRFFHKSKEEKAEIKAKKQAEKAAKKEKAGGR